MIAMNFPFWFGFRTDDAELHACKLHRAKLRRQMGKSLGGALSALLCTAAVAHHDAQHLRQQELRSTVRQQMGKPVPVRQGVPAPANQAAQSATQAGIAAAADANERHLNAQERVELRRQLARDLQAQRVPSNSSDSSNR